MGFLSFFKGKSSPTYNLNDDTRESALELRRAKAEIKKAKMDIELEKQKLELERVRLDLENAKTMRMQLINPPGNDGEKPGFEDNMMNMILMGMMAKMNGGASVPPQPDAKVPPQSPPPIDDVDDTLTDVEIREFLNDPDEVKPIYLKMAKKMPQKALKALINNKMPDLTEDELKRAITIIKE